MRFCELRGSHLAPRRPAPVGRCSPQAAALNLGERPMFYPLFSGWRKFTIAFLPSLSSLRRIFKEAAMPQKGGRSAAKGFKCDVRGQKAGKWPKKSLGGIASIVFYTTFALDDSLKIDALRSLLHMKTANFLRKKQSTRIPFLGDGPPSAREGTIFAKQVYTIRYGRGFLVLIFLLGFLPTFLRV